MYTAFLDKMKTGEGRDLFRSRSGTPVRLRSEGGAHPSHGKPRAIYIDSPCDVFTAEKSGQPRCA
jgi:hypothetical protein